MINQAITGAWYIQARRELDLLFPSGRRYRYANVPAEIAERFAVAESKGQFFNRHIRNLFPCRELGEELEQVA